MPQLKEYAATGNIRTDDKGFAAFETLGRRVGGQYDQGGNDLRDIGRAKAAVDTMIGRWPYNIIELEQRAAEQADKRTQGQPAPARFRMPGSTPANFHIANAHVKSITDEQFAPRGPGGQGTSYNEGGRGSHAQMSEGAGALGSMLGGMGGTMSPEYRKAIQAQQDAEQQRADQLAIAAADKRWNLYEQGLDKYNKQLQDWAGQPAFSEGNPYPTNQPVSTSTDPNSPYAGRNIDVGGGGDVSTEPPPQTDFGGNPSSGWTTFADQFGSTSNEGPQY